MKYVTFQGNFEDIKKAFKASGTKIKDLDKMYRFHAFSCDADPKVVQDVIGSVFPHDEDIPAILEKTFSESINRSDFFFDNHVHVIALC